MNLNVTVNATRMLSAIPLDRLEVGALVVVRTIGRRPYRFRVTERSVSDERTIAVGELVGGPYTSPRHAALVGGEHTDGIDPTAIRLGDSAVFLVDPVAGDRAD